MLDQATRLRLENIDWIIEHAPKIERGEWARKAIELLENEKQIIERNYKQRELYLTRSEVFGEIAEALYDIAVRTAEHEHDCEEEDLGWFDRFDWHCGTCELMAFTRMLFDAEELPEHYRWVVKHLADRAVRTQGTK